ncbi:hypothetical protein ACVBEH_06745 [Roseateles sp. GG27B]
MIGGTCHVQIAGAGQARNHLHDLGLEPIQLGWKLLGLRAAGADGQPGFGGIEATGNGLQQLGDRLLLLPQLLAQRRQLYA